MILINKIPPMFINAISMRKYILDTDLYCNFCRQSINQIGWYFAEFGQQKSSFRISCNNCLSKLKKPTILLSIITELDAFIPVSEIPNNTRPYIMRPPQIKESGNINCFDAANPEFDKKIGDGSSNYKIIDYTKFAGRADLQGLINVEKNKKLIEKKESELNNNDVDAILKKK